MDKILDLGHLQRQAMGDDNTARAALRLFQDRLPADLAAITGGAWPQEARAAAHRLAGAALAIGAFPLAAIAAEAEGAATMPHGFAERLQAAAAALEMEIGAALAAAH